MRKNIFKKAFLVNKNTIFTKNTSVKEIFTKGYRLSEKAHSLTQGSGGRGYEDYSAAIRFK